MAGVGGFNGFLVERCTPMASIKGDPMLSHVIVGVDGLEASRRFDDALLGTLGIKPGVNVHNGMVGRCLSRPPKA
jgi:hypothetical protein